LIITAFVFSIFHEQKKTKKKYPCLFPDVSDSLAERIALLVAA
jgi:hypothetical protein